MGLMFQDGASVTVSRVLSWTIIFPGLSSPIGSSDCGECDGPPTVSIASCTRWGLQHGLVAKPVGELLPRLSSLTGKIRRYISVALSLESPPPAVSWHPALWCPDFPRTRRRAIACSPRTVLSYPLLWERSRVPPHNSSVTFAKGQSGVSLQLAPASAPPRELGTSDPLE